MKTKITILSLLLSVGVAMGQSKPNKQLLFHVMDSVETANWNKQPRMFLMSSKNGKPDSSIEIYGDTIANIRLLWKDYQIVQDKLPQCCWQSNPPFFCY